MGNGDFTKLIIYVEDLYLLISFTNSGGKAEKQMWLLYIIYKPSNMKVLKYLWKVKFVLQTTKSMRVQISQKLPLFINFPNCISESLVYLFQSYWVKKVKCREGF